MSEEVKPMGDPNLEIRILAMNTFRCKAVGSASCPQ